MPGVAVNLGLEGRSALVCASTGGLGLASARALAAEGARVAVTGRRETVAQEIAGTLPGPSRSGLTCASQRAAPPWPGRPWRRYGFLHHWLVPPLRWRNGGYHLVFVNI